MTPLVRAPLCLSFLAVTVYLAAAMETVYSNINCAISFPLGWEFFPVDGTKYSALVKSADGMRAILLEGRAIDLSSAVDEEFRRYGKEAFAEEGHVSGERSITIGGWPGMELAGEVFMEGKSVSTVSRIVIAGDGACKVMVMSMGGDAASDRELQESLKLPAFARSSAANRSVWSAGHSHWGIPLRRPLGRYLVRSEAPAQCS